MKVDNTCIRRYEVSTQSRFLPANRPLIPCSTCSPTPQESELSGAPRWPPELSFLYRFATG